MAGAPPTMMPFGDVPVVVNSFNRLGSLRRLLDWLAGSGYRNLVVVDNASTYPPLVRYLRDVEHAGSARVVRLDANRGHTALWDLDLLGTLGIDTEFVYSDPDVVPAPGCPADVVRVLQELLSSEPALFKAGLGLRLDDLPRRYRHRKAVLAWETKNWLAPAAPGCFLAPIDTTFALYRPGSAHGVDELAVRTGPPWVAAHESWYTTGLLLRREERFYARAAAPSPSSTWARRHLPAWLHRWEERLDDLYPLVVLVAAGPDTVPGYVTPARLGRQRAGPGADGVFLPDGLGALARHGLRLGDLRSLVKANAKLVLRQSWPPPDAAGEERAFLEWLRVAVERRSAPDGVAVAGQWALARLQLVARQGSAVSEAVVHLRALPVAATEPPALEVSASRLDLHGRFDRL